MGALSSVHQHGCRGLSPALKHSAGGAEHRNDAPTTPEAQAAVHAAVAAAHAHAASQQPGGLGMGQGRGPIGLDLSLIPI